MNDNNDYNDAAEHFADMFRQKDSKTYEMEKYLWDMFIYVCVSCLMADLLGRCEAEGGQSAKHHVKKVLIETWEKNIKQTFDPLIEKHGKAMDSPVGKMLGNSGVFEESEAFRARLEGMMEEVRVKIQLSLSSM